MFNESKIKLFVILITFLSVSVLLPQSKSTINHFIPVWTNNPYLPMNIYISQALSDSIPLQAGDEIGVFDGNICVGSIKLNDSITSTNPVSIITSADDPLTTVKDGFTIGNKIFYRIWKSSSQKEIINCFAEYQTGTGNFVQLGSALLKLKGFSQLKISPLKLLIEGLYDGNKMVSDTVKIELRKHTAPYDVLDSVFTVVDSTGNSVAEFNSITLTDSFYIAVKHRNSIETWSNFPLIFNDGTIQYDFTIDSTMAYGNNLVKKSGRWCIYSGDVNQDGVINSNDLMLVYYDNVSGSIGYINTDINGDGYCEVSDVVYVFTRVGFVINKKTPEIQKNLGKNKFN
jgi:hypothetical protein